MSALPDQGSLAEHGLPRLMLALHRDRFAGWLGLSRDRQEIRLRWVEGAPVEARSSRASEGLAAQLGEAGRLEADQVRRAEALARQKGCPEAAALLALRLLEPRDLFHAVREHLRRRVLAGFEWSDGRFQLERDDAPAADAKALRVDPLRLVYEGLVRRGNVEDLARELAHRLEHYPTANERSASLLRRLGDDSTPASVHAALDGRRTLSRALGAAAASPAALAAVWVLDAAGGLAWSEAPRPEEDREAPAPEIEIEVTGGEASAGEAPRGPRRPAARRKAGGADEGKAEKLRQEILESHARLDEQTLYEALGLESNASAASVKKAYFQAAKRYHPDALSRLGLADLKREAGEVFGRITEAYETLSDASRRADYDARLEGGDGEADALDAARLAQAETFFRKGEILVKMGNFAGALEFLEPAVELWPEEAAYQAALGWALFKKAPPELERAREHLEQALALDEGRAVVHLRLGLVLRDLGDADAASRHQRRARELDPSVA